MGFALINEMGNGRVLMEKKINRLIFILQAQAYLQMGVTDIYQIINLITKLFQLSAEKLWTLLPSYISSQLHSR